MGVLCRGSDGRCGRTPGEEQEDNKHPYQGEVLTQVPSGGCRPGLDGWARPGGRSPPRRQQEGDQAAHREPHVPGPEGEDDLRQRVPGPRPDGRRRGGRGGSGEVEKREHPVQGGGVDTGEGLQHGHPGKRGQERDDQRPQGMTPSHGQKGCRGQDERQPEGEPEGHQPGVIGTDQAVVEFQPEGPERGPDPTHEDKGRRPSVVRPPLREAHGGKEDSGDAHDDRELGEEEAQVLHPSAGRGHPARGERQTAHGPESTSQEEQGQGRGQSTASLCAPERTLEVHPPGPQDHPQQAEEPDLREDGGTGGRHPPAAEEGVQPEGEEEEADVHPGHRGDAPIGEALLPHRDPEHEEGPRSQKEQHPPGGQVRRVQDGEQGDDAWNDHQYGG